MSNSLTLNEYQYKSSHTINNDISDSELIESCVLGLAGEVGKLSCIINSDRFKGFDCLEEKKGDISYILGDIQWWTNAIATAMSLEMGTVAVQNLVRTEKLYGLKGK